MPCDAAAEDAVIGSILTDGAVLRGCDLSPEDFLGSQPREAYRAVLALHERGLGLDQITVAQELARTGKLSEVGADYLAHVVSVTPTSLHCGWYAGIVREQSTRRRLIQASSRIADLAQGSESASDALAAADRLITELRKQRGRLEVIAPQDRASLMLEEYTTRKNLMEQAATPTYLPRLDGLLGGGAYPGELMVIGARPGIGKTTIAQWIANRAATTDTPVLFCSAEMTMAQLDDRDIAELTGLPLSGIRGGRYNDAVYRQICDAITTVAERNIYYLPRGGMSVARIAVAADAVSNRAGQLRLIVVDHLGRLRPATRGQPRHIELGEMTSDLADLAKEQDCPLILLCQLNRELEHRDDKRPTLNDLRESGRIEEDADIVLLMYRQGYYRPDPDNVTEIAVAKLRQSDDGRRRGVKLSYDRARGFTEID